MVEELAKRPAPDVAITQGGIAPASFEEAWRYANALAKTQFVPVTYQGKPEDCFIAIDISQRLGVHPMMFLQNSYIVHGRPAMEAKLVQSLVNKSGLFVDPLEYEVEGDDPMNKDYRVRAFAKRVSTGSVLCGPWITWALVSGEGWDSKSGSKWKTMPEVMFHYRAASWFCNRHCPEVKMGFMTTDEAEEAEGRKPIESKTLDSAAGTRVKFGKAAAKEIQEENPSVSEDVQAADIPQPSTDIGGTTPEPADTPEPGPDPTSAPPAETEPSQAAEADSGAATPAEPSTNKGNEDKQRSDPQQESPEESADTANENNPDEEAAQANSASTADTTSDEPQYRCKGCNTSPVETTVKDVKGKKVRFCNSCLSRQVLPIR